MNKGRREHVFDETTYQMLCDTVVIAFVAPCFEQRLALVKVAKLLGIEVVGTDLLDRDTR